MFSGIKKIVQLLLFKLVTLSGKGVLTNNPNVLANLEREIFDVWFPLLNDRITLFTYIAH